MKTTKNRKLLSASEFLITLGALNITTALVFPVVITICSQINAGRNVADSENNKNNGREYANK